MSSDPGQQAIAVAQDATTAAIDAGRFLYGATPDDPVRGQEAWDWCQQWSQAIYFLIRDERAKRVRVLITYDRE